MQKILNGYQASAKVAQSPKLFTWKKWHGRSMAHSIWHCKAPTDLILHRGGNPSQFARSCRRSTADPWAAWGSSGNRKFRGSTESTSARRKYDTPSNRKSKMRYAITIFCMSCRYPCGQSTSKISSASPNIPTSGSSAAKMKKWRCDNIVCTFNQVFLA